MKPIVLNELPDGRIQFRQHPEKIILTRDEYERLQQVATDTVFILVVDYKLQKLRNEKSNSDNRTE